MSTMTGTQSKGALYSFQRGMQYWACRLGSVGDRRMVRQKLQRALVPIWIQSE